MSSVEFHNVDAGTAVAGPSLPQKVWSGPKLMNVKETLYLLGGSPLLDVVRLEDDLGGWVKLPKRLGEEQKYPQCAVHFTWT